VVKYLLYVLRWIVLAIPGALFFNQVKEILNIQNVYIAMLVSQAILGAMVYFLDRLIFTSGAVSIPWEIRPRSVCADCGEVGKCYRVVGDRCCETHDGSEACKFRCEKCELKKIQEAEGA
jgi:hypothetical protein